MFICMFSRGVTGHKYDGMVCDFTSLFCMVLVQQGEETIHIFAFCIIYYWFTEQIPLSLIKFSYN